MIKGLDQDALVIIKSLLAKSFSQKQILNALISQGYTSFKGLRLSQSTLSTFMLKNNIRMSVIKNKLLYEKIKKGQHFGTLNT